MEIIKELNLNGNPQMVKNGSLTFAKNIRLSADGTYITNDEGFKLAIYTSDKELKVKNVINPLAPVSISGYIVGYINCPNEIVIFTTNDKIYRLVEYVDNSGLCAIEVNSAWVYSGGDIIGTFIYNVNKELIVAIAEYSDNGNVPLYVINLNKCSNTDDISYYSSAQNVPVANLKCTELVSGTIPCGTYYFFVRYKYNNLYTNWYPVGKSYNAFSSNNKELVNHTYNIKEDIDSPAITNKVETIINDNLNSDFTFNFTLSYANVNVNYTHVQIGYILQTNGAVIGRINNEYKLTNDSLSFIFDTLNSKETSIDSLIMPVFTVNNVKALTSFNNKLYVGNCKENIIDDDYESLKTFLSQNDNKIGVATSITDITKSIISSNIILELYYNSQLLCTLNIQNNNYKFKFVDYDEDNLTTNAEITSKILIDHFYEHGAVRISRPDKEKFKAAMVGVAIDFSNTNFILFDTSDVVEDPTVTYLWEKSNNDKTYDFKVIINETPSGTSSGGTQLPVSQLNINQDLLTPFVVTTSHNDDVFNIRPEIKTFMPGEIYDFYIHYIHKDGSYTDGLLIEPDNSLTEDTNYNIYGVTIKKHLNLDGTYSFRIPIADALYANNKLCKYSVRFSNVKNPDNTKYIGCFFTYVKRNKSFNVFVENVHGNDLIIGKALDYQLNLVNVSNCELIGLFYYVPNDKSMISIRYRTDISNIKSVLSGAKSSIGNSTISRDGIEGAVGIICEHASTYVKSGDVAIVASKTILNQTNAELIPFGYNLYFDNVETSYKENDGYNFNLPGYLCYDVSLDVIEKTIYTKEDNKVWKNGTTTFKDDEDLYNQKYVQLLRFPKYSNFNLNAISIKKEPTTIEAVYDNNKHITNLIVDVINISDLFELKSDYFYNNYKNYSYYDENKNYVNISQNMIRSSYPIRNESNENNWKVFDPEDYYFLNKNFGDIVHLFSVSKYFYIHTINTLLVASADATLNANNNTITLTNHKLFDTEPSELFTSDLGYGGIKYNKCQLFSNHGYIWYDTDHNKIFRLDNNKIQDLTTGIDELISKFKYEYCFINLDNKTNRIFFCFASDLNNDNNTNYFTIAYDVLFNKYISIMDFIFDKGLHTTNNVYFTLKKPSIGIYMYNEYISDINYNFGNYATLGYKSNVYNNINLSNYCCFDIIINDSPETPKVLESIRWIHSYINENIIDPNNSSELFDENKIKTENSITKNPEYKLNELENLILRIYNNNVDTTNINLFSNEITNINESHKFPHYEKGVWQFNYFRDIINNNIVSDEHSLIYGTYFIIRFICNSKFKLKFDNISVKLNKY